MNPTRRSLLVSGPQRRLSRSIPASPRAGRIETRSRGFEEGESRRRQHPDLKIRKVARFDSGGRRQAVSPPGILRHHLAPDRRDGRDQGRQHLLLLRFQGSHSRRGPASRPARRIRRGQDRVEARRQGLAPAPDRIGDRGASGGAAGGKRFHLGKYSHLWPAPRASQEAAPAVAEGLCAILGPAVSGRAACRRNSRRYRDRSAADIRAGRAELDHRMVRLQFQGGGA